MKTGWIGAQRRWSPRSRLVALACCWLGLGAGTSGMAEGKWSLNHRWIQTSGETEYGTVLVDVRDSSTYKVCRHRGATTGVGTRELFLFVDGAVIGPTGATARPYSLDRTSRVDPI